MSNTDQFSIKPIVATSSLRTLAYEALKQAITNMDLYGRPDEVRLDERKLSQDLGVSRTPVREALTVLEQEGFVRSEARRGIFVIKKTRAEIVGMIHAWAALESMAARLACSRATDAQLKSLRDEFPEFYEGRPSERNFVQWPTEPVAEQKVEERLMKEISFDPDVWVVEIEDRAGRHFLDLAKG